ncbi:MAG TPA: hypothetical protein VIV40_30595 [Kofleriaceae bacterium]
MFGCVLAMGSASADNQLATDAAPPAQLATTGCDRPVQLIGHDRGELARVMKERGLRPITLERILLPAGVTGGAVAPNLLVTIKLGDREVHGIYSNIAGDGCIRSDIRHAVDADGNLYQFDGPAGVVDYTQGRCHTARGWEPCNLRGVTNVLFVVPDKRAKLVGEYGSNLQFYAAR